MKPISMLFKVAFWLVVACLPLALDYEITDFMADTCKIGSECLDYAMPLIVQIGTVALAARVLLWPLAAWHLGGRWLWLRFHSSHAPQSAPDSTNT